MTEDSAQHPAPPHAAEPGPNADIIGTADCTVRAIGFAGGGFDTAMQLGVIHALMVSRAQPPDLVAGVSAGAFNAVALADVLQAGARGETASTTIEDDRRTNSSDSRTSTADANATGAAVDGVDAGADSRSAPLAAADRSDDPAHSGGSTNDRLGHRVAAFRRMFGRYRDAPGELASALLPDSYQIDSRKPLEVLRLATHFADERRARSLGSRSRRGLVNLYNRLLGVPLSVGTVTRAVRRYLGLKAVKNAATWRSHSRFGAELRKRTAQLPQVILLWKLLGWNLHRLAPIVTLLRAGLRTSPGPGTLDAGERERRQAEGMNQQAPGSDDEGVTAGELLFASRFWPWLGRTTLNGFIFLSWAVLWVTLTSIVLAIVTVLGWAVVWSISRASFLVGAAAGATGPPAPRNAFRLGVSLVLGSFLAAGLYGLILRSRQRFQAALKTLVELTGLTLVWGAVAGISIIGVVWLAAWLRSLVSGVRLPADALQPSGAIALVALSAGVILLLSGGLQAVFMLTRRKRLIPWTMRRHYLGRSLLDPHPLHELLVSTFDRTYYGPHEASARFRLETVVSSALNEDQPVDLGYARRTLQSFHRRGDPPIRVAVVAADVEQGRPRVLDGQWPVVDALMAATASVPFFPAVGRRDEKDGVLRYYVDASVVANEPTRMSLAYLRDRIDPQVGAVELYSVSPFPLSSASAAAVDEDESPDDHRHRGADEDSGDRDGRGKKDGGDKRRAGAFRTLVEVVTRAGELQRFRDARLEHRLTRLHSKLMRPGMRLMRVERKRPASDGSEKTSAKNVIGADVIPIEPNAPLRLTRRLLRAKDDGGRRQIIARGVAAGCRATLEVIALPSGEPGRPVSCWMQIASRLGTGMPGVPGADRAFGPGVPDVCRECRHGYATSHGSVASGTAGNGFIGSEGLLAHREHAAPSVWPVEQVVCEDEERAGRQAASSQAETAAADTGAENGQEHLETADAGTEPAASTTGNGAIRESSSRNHEVAVRALLQSWPRAGNDLAGDERPTVSVVFSGGVFRGVFQVGVIAAANELGIHPDIVAGASIGSITAAMAASAYVAGTSMNDEDARRARRRAIARVAATYLAVDRLVLTDRFADFIREFTVRAAEARFSIRDADRVFRKYDEAMPGVFGRESRRLAAGIERLTYVSPIELATLIRDLRSRDYASAMRRLRDDFQELLDRSGVGREILGAEPLAFLIREHVLRPLADKMSIRREDELEHLRIGDYLEQAGIYFVATATNLHRARLELLGDILQNDAVDAPATTTTARPHDRLSDNLLESLLASSAFPGVFRPR